MSFFSRRVVRAPFVRRHAGGGRAVPQPGWRRRRRTSAPGAVVIDNPANYTPSLVEVAGQPKPIVDAIAVSGNTVAAGGRFHAADAGRHHVQPQEPGAVRRRRRRVRAQRSTRPVVWAAAASGGWIYVGGQFTIIGGTTSAASRGSMPPPARSTRASTPPSGAGSTCWSSRTAGCTPAAASPPSWSRSTSDRRQHRALQPRHHRPAPQRLGQRDHPGMAINPAGHPAGGDRQLPAGRGSGPEPALRGRTSAAPRRRSTRGTTTGSPARAAPRTPRRIAYLQGVDFSPDRQPLLGGGHRADPAAG